MYRFQFDLCDLWVRDTLRTHTHTCTWSTLYVVYDVYAKSNKLYYYELRFTFCRNDRSASEMHSKLCWISAVLTGPNISHSVRQTQSLNRILWKLEFVVRDRQKIKYYKCWCCLIFCVSIYWIVDNRRRRSRRHRPKSCVCWSFAHFQSQLLATVLLLTSFIQIIIFFAVVFQHKSRDLNYTLNSNGFGLNILICVSIRLVYTAETH